MRTRWLHRRSVGQSVRRRCCRVGRPNDNPEGTSKPRPCSSGAGTMAIPLRAEGITMLALGGSPRVFPTTRLNYELWRKQ
jgi:hypothetical protein